LSRRASHPRATRRWALRPRPSRQAAGRRRVASRVSPGMFRCVGSLQDNARATASERTTLPILTHLSVLTPPEPD
jgi:hypothetical protein